MKNLFKKTIILVENLQVSHWLIIGTIVLMVCEYIYKKLMERLLRKIQMCVWHRLDMCKVVWQISYMMASIPLLLNLIEGDIKDVLTLPMNEDKHLDYQLDLCKMRKDFHTPGLKSVFVIHFSFYAAQAIFGLVNQNYKNLYYLKNQVLFVISTLTFYSRCPLYGMSLLILAHRSSLPENLSKLCVIFSHHTNSTVLRFTAQALYIYHIVLWIGTFLWILPIFLARNKTINSSMIFVDLNLLIIIHGMVCTYLIISWVEAPFTRMIVSYIKKEPQHYRTLFYFLFGTDLIRRSSSISTFDKNIYARRNAKALIQVIRVSIILKRKAKIIRERLARQRVRDEEVIRVDQAGQGDANL